MKVSFPSMLKDEDAYTILSAGTCDSQDCITNILLVLYIDGDYRSYRTVFFDLSYIIPNRHTLKEKS